ncbi:MAG: hypothetical protein ABNH21_19065 [Glaciecola sp.]|jgi:hypothetical protein
MGRVAEFKNEDIVKAGLDLEETNGKDKVTPAAIRNHLGGGSNVRIKEIWNNFVSQRDEEEVLENATDITELPLEVVKSFWPRVYSISNTCIPIHSGSIHRCMNAA